MNKIKQLYESFKERAAIVEASRPDDLNAALIALENNMADNSGLGEHDRLEARAYMQEYRRQRINGYEAGAKSPRISNSDSGPRQGEYDDVNG